MWFMMVSTRDHLSGESTCNMVSYNMVDVVSYLKHG